MIGAKFCCGEGSFHTNRAGAANQRPYLELTWPDILAMIANPKAVPKSEALWTIGSTLMSRVSDEQRNHGQYGFIGADIDKLARPIDDVAAELRVLLPGINFELYYSKRGQDDNPKLHVLIPLRRLVDYPTRLFVQKKLSEALLECEIHTDPALENPAQLIYLPNEGLQYRYVSDRLGSLLDVTEDTFPGLAAFIEEYRAKASTEALRRESAKTERAERAQAILDGAGTKGPIEDFNLTTDVRTMLLEHGYDPADDTEDCCEWRHPNSESGMYSLVVKEDGWVYGFSTSDPLGAAKNGGHRCSPFDVFTILEHGGDEKAAREAIGVGKRAKEAPEDVFTAAGGTTPPPSIARPVINAPDPFPGAHKALTKAILAASYIPQPNLASLCALIAMASVAGDASYADGTRCNLFGAVLSESSSGKEKPIECAQAAAIECDAPVIATPASGEALEDSLRSGGQLMIMREAAHIFRVMSGDNAAPHAVSLARMILDLFSAGERDKYMKRLKAGDEEQRMVNNPALSVLLASTPGKLGEALTTDNIGDGMLGRLLYAEGNPAANRQRHPSRFTMPAEFSFMAGAVMGLRMSDAADDLLWRMTTGFDAERIALLRKEERATAALLGRRAEKIKRIAGVVAAFDGGTVSTDMIAWAGEVCEASDAVLLSFTEEHLDKSKDIRDTEKIMAAIIAIANRTVKATRQGDIALIEAGFVPRSFALKTSHLSKAKFDLALEHLIEIRLIEMGTFNDRKVLRQKFD